jgi:hypothetical protein
VIVVRNDFFHGICGQGIGQSDIAVYALFRLASLRSPRFVRFSGAAAPGFVVKIAISARDQIRPLAGIL